MMRLQDDAVSSDTEEPRLQDPVKLGPRLSGAQSQADAFVA